MITVPLVQAAHQIAEQFFRQQKNPQKAKQVYLNTLAVYAVQFYLKCMGIETNWKASDSCNPVMQTLMDVADLEIPNRGKLECRPVLPETQVVHIPPEVCSDRIGYVAVQLDQSLKESTLLGFVEVALTHELQIEQLRSLENLLKHLAPIRQTDTVIIQTKLSQWLENSFETGWQSVEAFLSTNKEHLAFSLRGNSQLSDSVKRAKLIDLGLQLGSQSVALMVAIAPLASQHVGIVVQVHPTSGEAYLPPRLRLSLISEFRVTLQEVQSRTQDNYIQLKSFRGLRGECFNIQVAFGETSVTETFVI